MDITVSVYSYLAISLIMFLAGLYTTVARKNIIGIFLGIELILNSAALNFAAFSRLTVYDIEGQIFSIFITIMAAAEAALALALLLSVYRRFSDINAETLNTMKG